MKLMNKIKVGQPVPTTIRNIVNYWLGTTPSKTKQLQQIANRMGINFYVLRGLFSYEDYNVQEDHLKAIEQVLIECDRISEKYEKQRKLDFA